MEKGQGWGHVSQVNPKGELADKQTLGVLKLAIYLDYWGEMKVNLLYTDCSWGSHTQVGGGEKTLHNSMWRRQGQPAGECNETATSRSVYIWGGDFLYH